MSDWGSTRFGDLYLEPSRNGISVSKSLRGDGYPMVNMKELFTHDILTNQHGELVPLTDSELTRWALADGDLLFGRRSLVLAGAGKVSLVKNPAVGTVFESSIIRSRLDRKAASPEFYFYFFRSGSGRELMETIVEQTAVAGIRSSDLAQLTVPLPPLPEQRRIAAVLTALDDLIDTNRELIGALKQEALAAFDAASESGEIVAFGEIATQVRAGVSGEQLAAGTPYLGLEHFATGGGGITGVGDAGAVGSNKTRFRAGDVLYGKLRPYFRKHDRPGFDGVATTESWVLRPQNGWGAASLDAIVSRPEFTEFAMSGSGGTKMPRASWDHVTTMPVSVPAAAIRGALDDRLEILWRARVELTAEIADLTHTRDELLPLLMSGAVRVREDLAVA